LEIRKKVKSVKEMSDENQNRKELLKEWVKY
jgi:hypothetical protein